MLYGNLEVKYTEDWEEDKDGYSGYRLFDENGFCYGNVVRDLNPPSIREINSPTPIPDSHNFTAYAGYGHNRDKSLEFKYILQAAEWVRMKFIINRLCSENRRLSERVEQVEEALREKGRELYRIKHPNLGS